MPGIGIKWMHCDWVLVLASRRQVNKRYSQSNYDDGPMALKGHAPEGYRACRP